MNNNKHVLYWEDVDDRLIYAELDDKAWSSPEKKFGYEKTDSLYIYHDNKLAAFYSPEDTKKEAEVGYAFYSKEGSIEEVVGIKKEAKKKVDDFVDSYKSDTEKLSNEELKGFMLKALEHCSIALHAHYLSQAQFFERFEEEGHEKHIERFEEISTARFEYSRKAWSKALNFSHIFFEEYGRRHNLTRAQAESMTRQELIDGKVDKDLYQKRWEKFVLVSKSHNQTIFTDEKADEYIKNYENYGNLTSIKGVVGNRGVVQAPAFVLKNEHLDFKNLPKGMEKGMILIVQNSWPELTEYYKFAGAIVTNEGGITSHGVVVAREFGIPCIVATRIGTKIFKTGDIVEVDANKGTVTLIKYL